MSNFIVKFYNSIKIFNYKKTKNNYIQYLQLPKKQKNKFYVVITT